MAEKYLSMTELVIQCWPHARPHFFMLSLLLMGLTQKSLGEKQSLWACGDNNRLL